MKRLVEALIIAVIVMSLILPQGQKTEVVADMDDSTIVKDSDFLGCQRAAVQIEGMQLIEKANIVINPVFEPPAVIPTPPPDVSPM